jgi:hypothetical protein
MPSSPIHEACARQLAALPAQPWPTVILVDPGAEALLVSLDHHLALLRQVGASNLASLQSLAAAGVDANQRACAGAGHGANARGAQCCCAATCKRLKCICCSC